MFENFKAKLVSNMLPITEKRDNLVLNAVSFFILVFYWAHERLVQKKKTFLSEK